MSTARCSEHSPRPLHGRSFAVSGWSAFILLSAVLRRTLSTCTPLCACARAPARSPPSLVPTPDPAPSRTIKRRAGRLDFLRCVGRPRRGGQPVLPQRQALPDAVHHGQVPSGQYIRKHRHTDTDTWTLCAAAAAAALLLLLSCPTRRAIRCRRRAPCGRQAHTHAHTCRARPKASGPVCL